MRACKLADSLETDDLLSERTKPWDAIWLNPGGVDEAFVRKCFESGFLGVDEYTLGTLFPLIRAYASTRATVLIQGPTGTGKEMVADCI